MTLIVNVSKLKLFIEDKKSAAVGFKDYAHASNDMGDWMFQLGKEVAFKQVLKEIDELYRDDR